MLKLNFSVFINNQNYLLVSFLSSYIYVLISLFMNFNFIFQVYIRYTIDNWRTNAETVGRYKSSAGEDDAIDKFTFIISLPTDFPVL